MYILRFATLFSLKTDLSPAGLKILKIADGRSLQPLFIGGGPGFDIITFGGGKAQVAAGQQQHAIGQLQGVQNLRGLAQHRFMRLIGTLRMNKVHHFHLVKLVYTLKTARILAVGTGLAPETGGKSHIFYRKQRLVQYLIAVQIGYRNLGRGNQIKIILFHMVHIIGHFRQLPGAVHALLVDHKRRINFRIAVLVNMQIKHIVNQGPFQPGAKPLVDGKSAAADLAAPFKVQNIQLFTQFQMVFGLKIECRQGSVPGYLYIGAFIPSQGHIGMGDIGNAAQYIIDGLLYLVDLLIQAFNLPG